MHGSGGFSRSLGSPPAMPEHTLGRRRQSVRRRLSVRLGLYLPLVNATDVRLRVARLKPELVAQLIGIGTSGVRSRRFRVIPRHIEANGSTSERNNLQESGDRAPKRGDVASVRIFQEAQAKGNQALISLDASVSHK